MPVGLKQAIILITPAKAGKIEIPGFFKFYYLRVLKKIASILLLAILLFNWIGYRLLISYVEDRANVQLKAQWDENKYDESELVSIKLPAEHLGYYINSKQFERVDGQIEIGGIQYNYVKRRLYNDSLELLCVPNHTTTQLSTAKNEFFKLVNDLQGQGKKGNSRTGSNKNFPAEGYATPSLFKITDLYNALSNPFPYYCVTLTSPALFIYEQPPENI